MSYLPPSRTPLPPGFPLDPVDAGGRPLAVGDDVVIPRPLPDWLVHDLPPDEVERLRQVEGTVMPILEIDAWGFAWFGSGGPWFSLRPDDVVLASHQDR